MRSAEWILEHTLCFLSVADVCTVLACQVSLPAQATRRAWRHLIDRVALSRRSHKNSITVVLGPTHVLSVDMVCLSGADNRQNHDRELHSVLSHMGVDASATGTGGCHRLLSTLAASEG